MSEVNTNEVAATTPAVKKVVKKVVPATKKVTKKAAAKKVVKKTAKKTAAAVEKAPRARKEGLRKTQVEILRVLSKQKEPITKARVAELAEADPTKMGVFIGPRDGESAKTSATFPFPGLVELGFAKVELREETGRAQVVTITAKGRKAYEDAVKAAK